MSLWMNPTREEWLEYLRTGDGGVMAPARKRARERSGFSEDCGGAETCKHCRRYDPTRERPAALKFDPPINSGYCCINGIVLEGDRCDRYEQKE